MKTCSVCKENKSLDNFHQWSRSKDGLKSQCRSCISSIRRADYLKNGKLRNRKSFLKTLYGITLEDYDALVEKQQGACAICGEVPTNKMLAVDHCHDSLKVRGLLCNGCNLGLGSFKDDPLRLVSAAEYLRKTK